MGERTGIEWTDATWNPIRGCSRVSEGCRRSYAERDGFRFSGAGQPYEGLVQLANGHPQWTGKIAFVEKHLLDPLKWGPVVTGCLTGRELPHAKMALCWQHTFQVLTKRPERMLRYMLMGAWRRRR